MAQRFVPLLAGGAIFGSVAAYMMGEKTAPVKNQAFVFVKPHAVTDKVNTLVRDTLQAKGIHVISEGELTSEQIDKDQLIDQHYYAIASKATILKPTQLNIPTDKFKAFFGLEWDDAIKANKVFNAMDACKELGVDAAELNKIWATAKKANKLVKFGGGFYCGEVTYKKKTIYIFNGFFMEMRNAFCAPGRKIHYYTVEWESDKLSWSDFRGKVLGPTDPKDAPKDSLRGIVMQSWKELGLSAEPNVGDNAVHASASPFEGMAERMNWLRVPCAQDDFCSRLVRSGIPEETIHEWSKDPQVKVAEGKKGSLFDALEDMNGKECIQKVRDLYIQQK